MAQVQSLIRELRSQGNYHPISCMVRTKKQNQHTHTHTCMQIINQIVSFSWLKSCDSYPLPLEWYPKFIPYSTNSWLLELELLMTWMVWSGSWLSFHPYHSYSVPATPASSLFWTHFHLKLFTLCLYHLTILLQLALPGSFLFFRIQLKQYNHTVPLPDYF